MTGIPRARNLTILGRVCDGVLLDGAAGDFEVDQISKAPAFGRYDAVVCWHVFEHLEYPGELLRKLRGFLKPGGMLISQSGFHDQSTPMHHADPSDHGWEYVLKAHGFVATETPDVYQLVEVVEAVPA